MYRIFRGLAAIALAAASANPASAQDKSTMIKEALAAAPPALAAVAAVHDWEGNVLREGSSDYVCLPRTPDSEVVNSMCLDKAWLAWANAWMKKGPVNIDTVGTAYMLAGDGGASNIDPFAKEKTANNQWVVEGPHMMIVVPDAAALEKIPTDPNNGGPYVMWKGTPYAHIMAPLD
ncbi:MAG: hypothetical protein KAT39_05745 [Alphaproteobacteria bacterium]|nr:hypothetical protein [Alphaproteobacteria bacterium]